jgi:transposase-like protein
MKYSQEFKDRVVQKVLSGRNVQEVAEEVGVTDWSIYRWIKEQGTGKINRKTSGPRGLSLREKQQLLLESQAFTEETIGEWLRKKGLHLRALT